MYLTRCTIGTVNGVELFLLGRTLMKIGEAAMPAQPDDGARSPGSTRLVLTVLSDIVEHPNSAIGEIATRTGLPQSQVSTAVARLRLAGSVETNPDPVDRRRMLVRQAKETGMRVARIRKLRIDGPLAAAMHTTDAARVGEVITLLEDLAAQLIPQVHGRS